MHDPGVNHTLAKPDVGDTELFPDDSGQFFWAKNFLLEQELSERFGTLFLSAEELG